MGETSKMFDRRMKEGWFLRHAQNLGIDIGCGKEPVTDEVERWDLILGNSDATYMEGIPDGIFNYVHSSHCLEHLADPVTAMRNWWRILRCGGELIIVVPHRDLYEKKNLLPSLFNPDHKHFFLPWNHDPPHTLGLLQTVQEALGQNIFLQELRVLDYGYKPGDSLLSHPQGEYSIEIILKKPPVPTW
jgi:SAM-dependent methyltransferase